MCNSQKQSSNDPQAPEMLSLGSRQEVQTEGTFSIWLTQLRNTCSC